jgi:hypothetical protein
MIQISGVISTGKNAGLIPVQEQKTLPSTTLHRSANLLIRDLVEMNLDGAVHKGMLHRLC